MGNETNDKYLLTNVLIVDSLAKFSASALRCNIILVPVDTPAVNKVAAVAGGGTTLAYADVDFVCWHEYTVEAHQTCQ